MYTTKKVMIVPVPIVPSENAASPTRSLIPSYPPAFDQVNGSRRKKIPIVLDDELNNVGQRDRPHAAHRGVRDDDQSTEDYGERPVETEEHVEDSGVGDGGRDGEHQRVGIITMPDAPVASIP